ncbi:hypothetical protein F4804DRAFT_347520 [Jackrogersella minutella]|nr:hypothetical protein F4804DRAFT_347520 [Jackrogersella minutella]
MDADNPQEQAHTTAADDNQLEDSTRSLAEDGSTTEAESTEILSYTPTLWAPFAAEATPNEIQELITAKATCIFETWRLLKIVIKGFEEKIHTRWVNKSKPKRKALLLEVWPQIPEIHRPDIWCWKDLRANPDSVPDPCSLVMMPLLSIEDLCKTEPILMMLEWRARCHPETFVVEDFASLIFGTRTEIIEPVKMPGYFAVFRGRDTPQSYGKIYAWDSDEDGVQSESTRGHFGVNEAFWVLEAQMFIYNFLCHFSLTVLHDYSREDLLSAKPPYPPKPPFISSRFNNEGIEILPIAAYEDQYSVPGLTNFSRMKSLLLAKMASAEDHLWALRGDPGYFLHTAELRMFNMPESIFTKDGHADVTFREDGVELWTHVFRAHISEAIENVDFLNILFRKITHLQHLINHYKQDISSDRDLPLPLNTALFETCHATVGCAYTLMNNADIKGSIRGSKPLRNLYRNYDPHLEEKSGPPARYEAMYLKYEDTPDGARDHLLWLLDAIGHGFHQFILRGRGLHIELEWLFRLRPDLKSLITPWLNNQISTIGVLGECLHQIELYRPWISGYHSFYVENSSRLLNDYNEEHTQNTSLRSVTQSFWRYVTDYLAAGAHLNNKIYYPVREPYSEKFVNQRRTVEARFDKFWNEIIRVLKNADALPPRVLSIFDRYFPRTPPWIGPSSETKKGKKKGDKEDGEFNRVIAQARAENKKIKQAEKGKEAENRRAQKNKLAKMTRKGEGEGKGKGKEKERAKAYAAEADDEEIEEKLAKLGVEPRDAPREVTKRAMNVLDVLLFEGEDATKLREIAWKDFVYTMMAVGFKAERLYGSAWLFSRHGAEQEAIMFDEPYVGDEVIPYVIARQYGFRLRRNYQWKRDMFTLAPRAAPEAKS